MQGVGSLRQVAVGSASHRSVHVVLASLAVTPTKCVRRSSRGALT